MENVGKWITSIPMEVTIMRRSYTKQEKFDYVMECRSSGLSDYQWCKKNNISPSTFYNWTQQLKRAGCCVPEPADKDTYCPSAKQDIVPLEIVDENISMPTNTSTFPINSSAVEIKIGQATIAISNDVNPALFSQIMSCLGGCL